MQLFVEFEHVPALAVVVGVGDVRTIIIFILRIGIHGHSVENLVLMVAADENASFVLAGLQLNGVSGACFKETCPQVAAGIRIAVFGEPLERARPGFAFVVGIKADHMTSVSL